MHQNSSFLIHISPVHLKTIAPSIKPPFPAQWSPPTIRNLRVQMDEPTERNSQDHLVEPGVQ